MTLTADLAQISTDAGKFHSIVHGTATTTTATDNSSVPSLAMVLVNIGSGNARGPWVTATLYNLNDVVTNGGGNYRCISTHISSAAIATDISAGRWLAQTNTSDAGMILTGTLADARLSANVPLLNATNVFSQKQTANGLDVQGAGFAGGISGGDLLLRLWDTSGGAGQNKWGFQTRRGENVLDICDLYAGAVRMSIDPNGNVGIGPTTATTGNGLLQLASGTTKANGIAFGTDTFLFRSAANLLQIQATSGNSNLFIVDSSGVCQLQATASSTIGYLGTVSNHSVKIRTNATDAITIDTSQNTTLSGALKLPATTWHTIGGYNAFYLQPTVAFYFGLPDAASVFRFRDYLGSNLLDIGDSGLQAYANLGIGVSQTAGNGLLQLAAGTSKANGIAFGTDTFFYRSTIGNIVLLSGTTSGAFAVFDSSQNYGLQMYASTSVNILQGIGNVPVQIRSNSITALTIDTSQNCTFAGTLTGNGSGLTTLNASNLSSGTVPVARLSAFTTSTAGIVPASGAGGGTTVLYDNGTWAVPPGSGTVGLATTQTFTGVNTFNAPVTVASSFTTANVTDYNTSLKYERPFVRTFIPVTVANTVTKTIIGPASGTVFPGDFGPGRVSLFRLLVRGTIATTGTPTLRVGIEGSAFLFLDYNSISLPTLTGTCSFEIVADIGFGTYTAGTYSPKTTGYIRICDASGHCYTFVLASQNAGSTSTNQTINTYITWGTASASNTLTIDSYAIVYTPET